ncbi:MAG TPA: RagB/SusD family nutrient uptake outer membrane protein, partial [Anseongella sp.]|nr:RagB/SusD family nutrient uptake outer membrane protein [Anseongella sp.]
MKIKSILYIAGLAVSGAACSDYLETETPDEFSDVNFWKSESNVRTYNWEFYNLFAGYGNGSVPGDFYFTSFSDDQASPSFQQFAVAAPATSAAWDWYFIRKANIMLERIDQVPLSEEAKNHWKGIARFFRALDYFNKVRLFGDIPWISKSLDIAETDMIYKPRDPRALVMDSILADIDFAVANLREDDEENTVNRDIALALKSRICLYEGTYRKYHTELGLTDAAEFLLAAKNASEELIDEGGYMLGSYKDLYSSMDLAAHPEVLLYKKYLSGILTHSVIGFTNSTTQMRGLTKSAV